MLEQHRIQAKRASPALAPLVIGFVERQGQSDVGKWIQLPFAIPVIHLALGAGAGPDVAFLPGAAEARLCGSPNTRPTFVIAMSFGGAAALAPEIISSAAHHVTSLRGHFWRALHGQLSDAATFAQRVRIAERALVGQFASLTLQRSPWVSAADAIIRDAWLGPVAALAERFGVEERTLRNRFQRDLGWSPKKLLRVARFNRVLRTVHPQPWSGPPVSDPALEFVDQAHFHREFFAHAGISPRAFIAAKRRSGDVILHNVTLASLKQSVSP